MQRLTEEDRKSNNILHMALCAGLLMMSGVIYYLISSGGVGINNSTNSTFFIIGSVVVLFGLLVSSKMYAANIKHASSKTFDSYEDASANFRSANVLRWALIEGPSLVAVVLAFLEGNLFLFFPAMVGVLFLFLSKMNEEHFGNYRFGK